mmetsp:Transcript_52530/g.123243  ORF Transcript_52530/g.123243 Transcript_52530/m.123243 type:complete len:238 (+) Transcript_52530:3054-3767(+)
MNGSRDAGDTYKSTPTPPFSPGMGHVMAALSVRPVRRETVLTALVTSSTSITTRRTAILSFMGAPGSGPSPSKSRMAWPSPSESGASAMRSATPMRCSFIVVFFGSLSRYTINCGHLEGWSDSETKRCRLLRSTRRPSTLSDAESLFGIETMATATTSCSTSCGQLKAMTSRTNGCRTTTSSTSRGDMSSPPRLMTSLQRPVSVSQPPSCTNPMSPVLNHPSSVKPRLFDASAPSPM